MSGAKESYNRVITIMLILLVFFSSSASAQFLDEDVPPAILGDYPQDDIKDFTSPEFEVGDLNISVENDTSTVYIRDDATGGDCYLVGTWDSGTKTCTLTGDLTESIWIRNSFVTLDCAGHSITGPGDTGIFTLWSNNVTIQNCTVSKFTYGILLTASDGNVLVNNTLNNNRIGIQFGVYPYGPSSNNLLLGNIASYNTFIGILFNEDSHRNTLINNIANNNFAAGIYHTFSSNNTIIENRASYNGYYGIGVSDSSHNTLINNTANYNAVGIAVYGWIYGPIVNNILINNTVNHNRDGIHNAFAYNGIITDNNASYNTKFGIYILYSINTTLIGNIVNYGYDGIWLLFSDNNNLIKNTVNYNYRGISAVLSHNNNIKKNTALYNLNDGIALDRSNSNTLDRNRACTSGWYDIYEYGSIGNTFVRNTCEETYGPDRCHFRWKDDLLIDENVTMCPGTFARADAARDGLVKIAAKDVTLDCTGATVIGDVSGTGIINTGFNNTGLVNCDMRKYANGVSVDSANGTRVTNSKFGENSNGILLTSATNTTVSGIEATGSDFGIRAVNSSDTLISSVNASYNNYGIYLSSSHSNTLSSNIASNNMEDGIFVYSSDYTNIADTNASNNNAGIHIISSSDDTLVANVANYNVLDGMLINGSKNIAITGGSYQFNFNGINIVASESTGTLAVTASNNLENGIYVNSSFNTTVTGVTASDNMENGVFIYESNNTSVSNSIEIGRNHYGIHFNLSQNNSVTSNDIRLAPKAGDEGVRVFTSNFTDILYNTFRLKTGTIGVHVINSSPVGNQLENKFIGPGLQWVSDPSSNALFLRNLFSDASAGVWATQSFNFTFIGNEFVNNEVALHFVSSANISLQNDTIINSTFYDLILNDSTITFSNVSFDKEKVKVLGVSILQVSWYLDVILIDEEGNPLENATVIGYNLASVQVFNTTTNENGKIPTQSLIEYVQTAIDKMYHSPYTLVASKPDYLTNLTKVNLTKSMKLVIVLKKVPPIIPAIIDIDPDTLSLKSQGKWITAYIEIPGYDVRRINISTVVLNGIVWAENDTKYGFVRYPEIIDRDGDGLPELIVKFDRSAVQAIVVPGNVTLTLTGKIDNLTFEGNDTVRVIEKGEDQFDIDKSNERGKGLAYGRGSGSGGGGSVAPPGLEKKIDILPGQNDSFVPPGQNKSGDQDQGGDQGNQGQGNRGQSEQGGAQGGGQGQGQNSDDGTAQTNQGGVVGNPETQDNSNLEQGNDRGGDQKNLGQNSADHSGSQGKGGGEGNKNSEQRGQDA